jgi:glycosyltransferase involved in cell wall biosynthesis
LKVSIITAVLNAKETIKDTIEAVSVQTYEDVEHILVDGGSTDGTVDVIREYADRNRKIRWISEPDQGIYDAMNKSIKAATGEIIGILNSDDFYADKHVIKDIVTAITKNNADSCYGDIVYVDRHNLDKIVRHWKAGGFDREKFKKGWMPPHPTFFCKRSVYEKYGLLNLDFPLAADYELMLRFLYKYRIRAIYVPRVLVKMRTKGTSKPGMYTLKAIIENYRSWKVNELYYPIALLLKPFSKIPQFFMRDKK